MIKVLFLEDEPVIAEVLSEYMKMQGYGVCLVTDGSAALERLAQENFHMMILDICVPGPSGLEVLAEIRAQNRQLPAIMLTALDDEPSQLRAFNLYADDYVVKPVSPLLLLKRMETILRRSGSQPKVDRHESGPGADEPQETVNRQDIALPQEKVNRQDIALPQETADRQDIVLPQKKVNRQDIDPSQEADKRNAGLEVRAEAYQAFYNGQSLGLTVSEFLLLLTLYQKPEWVYTREQLILQIYNEDYIGNDRIIDAHVKNLRKKLPLNCIKTVIGVGYQFTKEDGNGII